ncbi:hypothetical protein BOC44_21200 (plasmid) [Burkholderia pseudomallei]|nr:hypothetical protein BOC44_21200 [Burkholderia pseudomallei]
MLPLVIPPDFAKAFRRERKARGRTQQWVADKSGLARYTIMQLEAGQNVGLHHVIAALAALGLGMALVPAQPTFEMLGAMFPDDE